MIAASLPVVLSWTHPDPARGRALTSRGSKVLKQRWIPWWRAAIDIVPYLQARATARPHPSHEEPANPSGARSSASPAPAGASTPACDVAHASGRLHSPPHTPQCEWAQDGLPVEIQHSTLLPHDAQREPSSFTRWPSGPTSIRARHSPALCLPAMAWPARSPSGSGARVCRATKRLVMSLALLPRDRRQ